MEPRRLGGVFLCINSVLLSSQTIPNGNYQEPTLVFGLCGFGRFSNCRNQCHSRLVGQKRLYHAKRPSYKSICTNLKPYSTFGGASIVLYINQPAMALITAITKTAKTNAIA